QKCNTIFILINNEGYLIERVIFDDGYYNDIQNWKYSQLPGVFGDNCIGFEVRTEGEFEAALESAAKEKDKLVFIEARIGGNQCSEGLARLGDRLRQPAKKG
ncbi:MAG: hypothetical protein QG635_1059, partial [Bacteroidota bacterium]|nr:hypothetical protein [Bacteroidota bacterium]